MIIDSSSMACGMAYGATSRSIVAQFKSLCFFFFPLHRQSPDVLTCRGDGVELDEQAEVTAPHATRRSVWAAAAWGAQGGC